MRQIMAVAITGHELVTRDQIFVVLIANSETYGIILPHPQSI